LAVQEQFQAMEMLQLPIEEAVAVVEQLLDLQVVLVALELLLFVICLQHKEAQAEL
jgi:hypothetical protein